MLFTMPTFSQTNSDLSPAAALETAKLGLLCLVQYFFLSLLAQAALLRGERLL